MPIDFDRMTKECDLSPLTSMLVIGHMPDSFRGVEFSSLDEARAQYEVAQSDLNELYNILYSWCNFSLAEVHGAHTYEAAWQAYVRTPDVSIIVYRALERCVMHAHKRTELQELCLALIDYDFPDLEEIVIRKLASFFEVDNDTPT